MNLLKLLSVLAVALVLGACGGGFVRQSSAPTGGSSSVSTGSVDKNVQAMPPAATAAAGAAAGAAAAPAAPALDSNGSQQNSAANKLPSEQLFDRLVIKNADLTLQVEDVSKAVTAIQAKVAALNGYIVKVQADGSGENMTTQMTVRVPSERFDDALSGVQGLAKKVLSRTISGSDVTEEYVDLESRLRNLDATRTRLQSFLDKATKVEDALSVNNSLTEIQGQIEQIQGRMQYLKQSSAMSSLNVALQPVPVTPIIVEDGWQPMMVARDALRTLLELGQGLANVAIVFLVWTPVWLPLLLLALWGRRKLQHRDRQTSKPTV